MKYWGEKEEEAIVSFNQIDDVEFKNQLYSSVIEPAFKNLIENIYYTFNFNRTLYDFDTIKHEATTHLYEKLSKYDASRNKKSYSYFGTIVKNWLIQQSNSYKKRVFIDENENEVVVSDLSVEFYEEKELEKDNINFINDLERKFSSLIEDNNKFTDDDILVLGVIKDILTSYDKLYITNKKQLYLYIKEATDLPSRKITKSLNKIKLLYKEVRFNFIED